MSFIPKFKSLVTKALSVFGDANITGNVVANNIGSISPSNYTQSDTAPISPKAGDQWLRTTTGQKFEYYDGYWIDITGGGVSQGTIQTALSAGDYTFGGKVTANGQPALSALGSNDVLTKSLGDAAYGVKYYAYKAVTTGRASTIDLADDPELSVTLPVGVYLATIHVHVLDQNLAGFKWELGGTATKSGQRWTGETIASSGTQIWSQLAYPITGETVAPWATQNRVLRLEGLLIVTIAGTVVFRWAQNTSNAFVTNVFNNSYMTFEKLGV